MAKIYAPSKDDSSIGEIEAEIVEIVSANPEGAYANARAGQMYPIKFSLRYPAWKEKRFPRRWSKVILSHITKIQNGYLASNARPKPK